MRLVLVMTVLLTAHVVSACAQSAHQSGRYLFDRIVPRDIRKQVDWSVSFPELRAAPSAYQGRTVVLGGVVDRTRREQGKTEIEVTQLPLTDGLAPYEDRTRSGGKFIAVQHGSLERAVHAGDPITVVGRVEGNTGEEERDGTYPVIAVDRVVDWESLSVQYAGGYPPYASYAPYAYPYTFYPYHPGYYYGGYYGYSSPFWGYSPFYPLWNPAYGAPAPPPPAPRAPESLPPQFRKRD